jgi:hypothetical protein
LARARSKGCVGPTHTTGRPLTICTNPWCHFDMSSAAITKREEQIQSLKSRLSSLRASVAEQGRGVQRVAVASGAALALGAWEASRQRARQGALPTVAGLNPYLTWGGGMYVAAQLVGGRAGEVMEDASIGVLAVYAHQLGGGTASTTTTPAPTGP